jgi:hypothetical protein
MPNSVAYLGYSHSPSGSQSHTGKYQITLTGTYVPVTGESVSLLTASNPNGLELNGAVPMVSGAEVDVVGENIGGYQAVISNYIAGTFQLNIFASGNTELANIAYPASITGGNITVAVPHRL